MARKSRFGAILLALLLVLTPLAASAMDAAIPGVLVKQTIHEVPVPDVAMASNGSSLLVWQDAIPGDTSSVCTSGAGTGFAGECSILGSIVGADGVTVGTPFVVSGDITLDYYLGAPAAVWNEDLNEWLVLFTSYNANDVGVYAQRVSASGSLVGTLEELPLNRATTLADRNDVKTLSLGSPGQVSANWSSADQAYLVTWHAVGDSTLVGGVVGNTPRVIFGYFMNGDLTSADGVNASFLLSPTNTRTFGGLVKQAYSPALDKWALIWAPANDNGKLKMLTLTLNGTTIAPSQSVEVADASSWDHWLMAGDIVWVDSAGYWVISWNGKPTGSDPVDAFARTVAPDGTLGTPVKVTDFSTTWSGGFSTDMVSHQLHFDSTTGVIHASGMAEEEFQGNYNVRALTWSFSSSTLQPISSKSLIASSTINGQTSISSSSRAKITGYNGGIAIVYQNWPINEWGPAEVRYHLLSASSSSPTPSPTSTQTSNSTSISATLAKTGAESVWLIAFGLIAVFVGLGLIMVSRGKPVFVTEEPTTKSQS